MRCSSARLIVRLAGERRNYNPMLFKLVQRIREEFEETPDLRVTIGEAARFWGLDEETCCQVLGELVAAGFLAMDFDGRYAQAALVRTATHLAP